MTNEDIEREARLIGGLSGHDLEERVARIVSRAYEEAIPLVCPYCADGLLLARDEGDHYIHVVPTAVFANDNEDPLMIDMPHGCYAQKLRALKDSLVPSSVSSSQ